LRAGREVVASYIFEFKLEDFSTCVTGRLSRYNLYQTGGGAFSPPSANHKIEGLKRVDAEIITLPGRAIIAQLPPPTTIVVPLENVAQARATLTNLEAAVTLALATLAKAPDFGEAAALDGARQIFAAVVALL
jgi:hypothetical protein